MEDSYKVAVPVFISQFTSHFYKYFNLKSVPEGNCFKDFAFFFKIKLEKVNKNLRHPRKLATNIVYSSGNRE
jgi:hypothetical protein